MPVATLILIRPGIEVKPVKGNPLDANRDRGHERADLAIEAVFVHSKVVRGVAESDEARYQQDWRAVMERGFTRGDGY
jgi:hypothetical protein